mgnify:CR=1 FL=1
MPRIQSNRAPPPTRKDPVSGATGAPPPEQHEVNTAKSGEVPFEAAPQTAKQKLVDAATKATTEAAVAGDHEHPLLEKFGEHVGLALGVIVTQALALSKEWNAPLTDTNGKPVEHIEGADRLGNHDLRKRHQEVVGPLVEKYVETLKPGIVHELLEGFARGASAAPGATYRLEAAVSDWLHGAR